MTILQFPIEIQEDVYKITGQPALDEPIDITVKFKETLSDEVLGLLKALGAQVKFMTPVK
jgi:hypothetical protein